ncbi:MAG: hypothetical protein LBG52_01300 [Candidatus Peribacteria bacterium]|jgi:hypothetical protein|nr:hypothetical protein [Candidatus Peribacteria bacterium]
MEVSPSESTVGLIPNTDSISQSQQSVVVQQPMQTTPIPQDKQMLQPVQAQMPSTESQKASGFFSLLKHIFDVLLLKTGSRISRGEF